MGILDDLLNGGERQTQYKDFIERFGRGTPYDSIRDDEALTRYKEITPDLSRDEYRASAQDAFSRLSPEERRQFSQWMRTRSRDQGFSVPDYDLNDDGIDDRMQGNPGDLAEMTTRFRDRNPNILEQLLGKGGTGGTFDNPIAKAAFAGIAAMAAQRLMGSRR